MVKSKSKRDEQKSRITRQQRRMQIAFIVISIVLVLSMALSMATNL
jgi:hypothetical protein